MNNEGLHNRSAYPYYGYGHKRLPNEKFSYDMTEAEAETLLCKDLAVRYELFRKFGKDALLLTVLSYNVGQGVLLGHGGHPKGKPVRPIKRRRKMEFLRANRYRGHKKSNLLRSGSRLLL